MGFEMWDFFPAFLPSARSHGMTRTAAPHAENQQTTCQQSQIELQLEPALPLVKREEGSLGSLLSREDGQQHCH